MNREKALKILGLSTKCSFEECKKKYRALMLMTHPDMANEHSYPYEASEINIAYEYLLNHWDNDCFKNSFDDSDSKRRENTIKWSAPQNPNAYIGRNIFHAVEDSDGIQIGQAVIDHGPYLWSEEEDFSLFLKSLLLAGKEIIERDDTQKGCDRSGDLRLLSEIVYLLAQQFVDYEMVLSLLACTKSRKESEQDFSHDYQMKEKKFSEVENIYEIDAMLEVDGFINRGKGALSRGDLLYPSKLTAHKLYVKNGLGKEIGYISFKDDRLYYGIIPLLERRRALVKMVVKDAGVKRLNRKKYLDVAMYLKLEQENRAIMVESINLKIDKLLER